MSNLRFYDLFNSQRDCDNNKFILLCEKKSCISTYMVKNWSFLSPFENF